MDLKQLWFIFNLLFIINFTLKLMRSALFLPVLHLPNFFNTLFLLIAYTLSLMNIYRNIKKLIASQNFVCIVLFITFPHWVLLTPFFLLSIYNSNGYIISRRRELQDYFFFKLCVALNEYAAALGHAACCAELACLFLSLVFYTLRISSFKTLFMYYVALRRHCSLNPMMQGVVVHMLRSGIESSKRLPGPATGYAQSGIRWFGKSLNVELEGMKKIRTE